MVITEAGNAPNVVGLVYVAAFPADFATDVPPVTAAAWHQKKSWALIATRDRNINPDLERSMAKHAGSETIEVPASHAVYISEPSEVARLIERAAKASGR